jgi:hypothetical protein
MTGVGRPRKNESFISSSIDSCHEGSEEYQVSKVKIPNYNKVIYTVKCSEDNNGKNLFAEAETYCNNFQHTKEEVTKDIEKQSFLGVNYKVVRFEPIEIPIKDECPTCHKIGIPKIDRKSNRIDYHTRKDRGHRIITNRPDDYRLVYDHKIGKKTVKHVISTLDKVMLNFIKHDKTHTKTKENIFPFYLKTFKKFL